MEYNKNKMINETLDKFFETWQHTQDTADFVNPKFLKSVDRYIFKNLKKKFKEIDVYSLLIKQDNGVKLNLFDKLRVNLSQTKNVYKAEKLAIEKKKRLAEERKRLVEEKKHKRRTKK